MKRLALLTGPFKDAVAQKAPEAGQMQTLVANVKDFLKAQNFAQAALILDQLEPLIAQFKGRLAAEYNKAFLKLKSDTNKKIARLESHPQKALIATEIAEIKKKDAEALAVSRSPRSRLQGRNQSPRRRG